MKIEKHMTNLKESLEILEECIQKGMYVERQRTIGFHCSVAAVDMLEIYLHKSRLIDPGKQLKHDWFLSERKAEEKLGFDFPDRKKIIGIIVNIESKRDLLCYGAPQEKEAVKGVILKFNELRKLLEKMEVDHE
jgi:hypothetical protein